MGASFPACPVQSIKATHLHIFPFNSYTHLPSTPGPPRRRLTSPSRHPSRPPQDTPS
ncbi:hypothetical protein BC629DRAFT_1515809 [Irpex lacteus]|nr:hypothetical protein BC629DRAFT_1515809 [Irpex lacteus]